MTTQTENAMRVEHAYRAVLGFKDDGSSVEEAVTDLIADMLHLIDRDYGEEPEAILRSAWHHFMAEREES